MTNAWQVERTHFDEIISRVQVVLGRVAALRSQLRDVDAELGECESVVDELIQRLAQSRRALEAHAHAAKAEP